METVVGRAGIPAFLVHSTSCFHENGVVLFPKDAALLSLLNCVYPSLFPLHQTVVFDLFCPVQCLCDADGVQRGEEGLTLEKCEAVRRALRLNGVQHSAEVPATPPTSPCTRLSTLLDLS